MSAKSLKGVDHAYMSKPEGVAQATDERMAKRHGRSLTTRNLEEWKNSLTEESASRVNWSVMLTEQIIPPPEAEDFMIGVAKKEKEQQSTERGLVKREKLRLLRLAFWEQTLAALEEAGVTLYSNVSPSKDHWLNAGSGLSGVPYTMIFSQKEARADLTIGRGTKVDNKWIFDRLYEQKEAIETDFGAPLEWLRLDNKKASGIRYRKEFDGYDPDNWPAMIEWLTKHVKRLENAFGLRLKPLGQKLKTELHSAGAFQEEVEV